MKISRQHQSIHEVINADCEVIRPHFNEPDLDFIIVKINGRYPLQNYSVNQVCKEILYVSEGSGRVVVGDTVQEFQTGDTIVIEPGEVFYWEGKMTLFVSSRPAWYSEQHVSMAQY